MFFKSSGYKASQKTDDELIKGFTISGDPEVLGELYSRYMHLIRSLPEIPAEQG